MKNLYKILIIFMLLIFMVSCAAPKKIKNEHVNAAVSLMSEIEMAEKVEAGLHAFDVSIDIYVTEAFSDKDAENSLEIAKNTFNVETINSLMEEFDLEYPPDTHIFIRNNDGEIIKSFWGSCYSSYTRGVPPDYDEYKWTGDGGEEI